MSPSSPIVEARSIVKTYDTGAVRVAALRGVDLTLERGEMAAIMGPSGCGKTTLLNCLSGLDTVDDGEVVIEGTSLSEMSDSEPIGQDLRPRLTAIGAAVRELKRSGSGDKQLVSAIGAEAGKLDRYIANLLDLEPGRDQQPIIAGGVLIDLYHRSVTRDGAEVHLTPKEYAVLAELAKHQGRVLTHAHLLRTVWGPAQERQTDYLRVAIRALRQKLEADPAHPALIVNEPAVGYRLSLG